MSAGTQVGHAPSNHDNDHGDGAAHGSLKGYLIGFGLSVVLTAIPFWLVMAHVLPTATATVLAVMALAAVQVVVHMVYFLHLNTKSEAGWTMLALIFTLVVVAIALSGSLWVMYHMNTNMMPMSAQDARNVP
ncbi:MAG: cytochrome o ubiquinol oxidase subunit IV [Caulobacteraceae bacterium]